jgi:lactate permease
LGRRTSAARAGLAGWLTALVLAVAVFGAGSQVLLVAQGKALLLSAYVLYIIWMALLFYHVLNEAGAVRSIGAGLTALTTDRNTQALLLSWTFGSFLQGVSGYGVPAAVVAPLVVGLGFPAADAVVIAGLGHAWAVTFGSLAASFQALVAASSRPAAELALPAAVLLGVACFGCGVVVQLASGGLAAVRRGWQFVLVVGVVMSGAQFLLAWAGLYPIASIGAGLAGLAVGGLLARYRRGRSALVLLPDNPAPAAAVTFTRAMPLPLALLPYGLLVLLIGLGEFVPAAGQLLDSATVAVAFPRVQTAPGYVTPPEVGRTLSVLGHPGALLAYSALAIGLIYRRRGYYAPGAGRRIRQAILKGALLPSVGIASMVAMAITMEHAGMTRLLAEGLAALMGPAFPAVAPFIGALGAFMTGSNTNSNVVFTALQENTAAMLSLSPAFILAAQTTGGALGAAFAPAKVIIGCSTVGLAGQEAGVLRTTLGYGLALLIVIGLLTLLIMAR